MTTTQKAKVAVILTNEVGDCVPQNEITNTIYAMEKVSFGNDGAVDKAKLAESCTKASKYLNSIVLPLDMMAMNAIYKNKVSIAMGKIQSELK
jgi:hypothetical protein